MEPITVSALIIKKVGISALQSTLNKIIRKILKEFSNHRAEQFLATLGSSLSAPTISPESAAKSNAKLKNLFKENEELLMQAYKKATWAVSRDYGPVLLAIIVSRILAQERSATPVEEDWFRVAEALTDIELVEMIKPLEEGSGDYVQRWKEDSPYGFAFGVSLDVGKLGSWAVKLLNLGIMKVYLSATFHKAENSYDLREDEYETDPTVETEITAVLPENFRAIAPYIRNVKQLVPNNIARPGI